MLYVWGDEDDGLAHSRDDLTGDASRWSGAALKCPSTHHRSHHPRGVEHLKDPLGGRSGPLVQPDTGRGRRAQGNAPPVVPVGHVERLHLGPHHRGKPEGRLQYTPHGGCAVESGKHDLPILCGHGACTGVFLVVESPGHRRHAPFRRPDLDGGVPTCTPIEAASWAAGG